MGSSGRRISLKSVFAHRTTHAYHVVLCWFLGRMSKLVETISSKPLPAHFRYIVLEVLAENEEGEDVDVPYVRMRIRP